MFDLSLKELTLSHFRSHRHSALALDGRPVAIYGPNGAGKTNIIEAISMLSPGRGLRRARAEDISQTGQGVGWKIVASLSSPDNSHDIETVYSPDSARRVRIDDKTATQQALGDLLRVLWLVPSMDRLWIEGADGRRRFLDRIALSFSPDHAEASLAYEKAMRERNRLLKDQVRDAFWYQALEQTMSETGAKIMQNRRLAVERITQAQSQAMSSFPVVELALEPPEGQVLFFEPDALKAALGNGRQNDSYAGRTLVGPHRIDLAASYAAKGIEARQASTGEQKSLLISIVLANARALAEIEKVSPVLLLDEVAAHLDENRRAALYDEICDLNVQVFMTGTGRELFEALGSRAQYFAVSEDEGLSTVVAPEG